MTREEAIKRLELHKRTWLLGGGFDLCDALDMAIAALREQSNATQRVANTDNALTNTDNALTNAQHIRSMSDEELAQFIPNWSYTDACSCGKHYDVGCNNECEKCVAEWLKQPSKEDT